MRQKKINRRSFIAGAATTGVLAAGGALHGCQSTIASGDVSSSTSNPEWDREVDVVVIGSGTASWGAVTAVLDGNEVVVLEKSPSRFGGTSSISSGSIWVPQNYLMEESGQRDDREACIAFIKLMSEGQVSDEVIESFVDNAPKFGEFNRDVIGIEWKLLSQGYFGITPEMPIYLYDDRSGNICRSVAVDIPESEGTTGIAGYMWAVLEGILKENNAEIMMGTEGSGLIQDETGAVIGVKATSEDSTISIRARKGVLVGTGGFDFNENYRSAFLKTPIINSNVVETNTGDGITMGLEVGAALRGMNNVYGEAIWLDPAEYESGMFIRNLDDRDSTFSPRSNPNSIIVNKYGRRFGNESSAYSVWNRAYESWDTGHLAPNIEGFFIADKTYTDHYVLPLAARMDSSAKEGDVGVIPDQYVSAETLDELADKLGIDKVGLAETVKRYNEYCKEGKDYDFARGESIWGQTVGCDRTGRTDLVNLAMGPVETPPFYGVMVLPGSLGTSGGLVINGNAQVINKDGDAILGLYACGCAALSVYGPGYPGSGAPVGCGSIMAYVAAKHMSGTE